MDATGILAAEVEEAIARGDAARCGAMLGAVTELFLAEAARLGGSGVEAFDVVLLRLSREADRPRRIDLSLRLADLRNAPRGVVRDLALDAVADVAAPVLERSPVLAIADLALVARARTQAHLLAIARRRALAPLLADILTMRGERPVLHALARNAGASLSSNARALLAARAKEDPALQDLLRARADLAPEERAGLAAVVLDRMRETLGRDLGAGAAEAFAQAASRPRESGARRTGGIDEGTLIDRLNRRQVAEALEGLAQRSGASLDMVQAAHAAAGYEALLVIVRAAGLGWLTLKLYLGAEPRRRPPDYILESAFQAFQAVSIQTARQVVQAGAQPSAEGARAA